MSIEIDISKGKDPVPVYSDIRNDCYVCHVGRVRYTFYGTLPFTLKRVGKFMCADREFILKHEKTAHKKEAVKDG